MVVLAKERHTALCKVVLDTFHGLGYAKLTLECVKLVVIDTRSQLGTVKGSGNATGQVGEFHPLFVGQQGDTYQLVTVGKAAEEGRVTRRIALDVHETLVG